MRISDWSSDVCSSDLLLEYVPFIILLLALFTVAGGVRLKGDLVGSPGVNTALLAVGTIIASWMGTTGAAMLMIRPVIRANEQRRNKAHVIVFFIFLVANIGEIGRASCRDRVCQYVYISVVAVSLKHKQQHKKINNKK